MTHSTRHLNLYIRYDVIQFHSVAKSWQTTYNINTKPNIDQHMIIPTYRHTRPCLTYNTFAHFPPNLFVNGQQLFPNIINSWRPSLRFLLSWKFWVIILDILLVWFEVEQWHDKTRRFIIISSEQKLAEKNNRYSKSVFYNFFLVKCGLLDHVIC